MTELSTFIDAHPWVTFGAFVILWTFADGTGKWFRVVRKGKE